jgi:hypothetical protein
MNSIGLRSNCLDDDLAMFTISAQVVFDARRFAGAAATFHLQSQKMAQPLAAIRAGESVQMIFNAGPAA